MGKVKKILLALAAIAAIVIVPLFLLFATMSDDNYRKVIIWGVHRFTDYELEINGAFSVAVSMQPAIAAKQVNIRPSSRSHEVSIETIDFQVALIPLFSNTLSIKYLNASDVDIKSYEIEEELTAPDETRPLGLLPILELAELTSVRYTRERSGDLPPVDFFLEKMRLMEVSPDGSRVLEGAGRIGTDAFVLNGEMGSLGEFFEPTQPFPLLLDWELPGGTMRVEGTIGQPSTAKAVDLAVSSSLQDVDYLLSRFYPDMPDLGRLDISGKLTGDYPAFALESLQLSLLRDEVVKISASGRVEDITNMVGLDVQYEIALNDSDIIHRYLPERSPRIQQLITNGSIRSSKSEFLIKDAKLRLANNEGLVIHAEGYTDLIDFSKQLPLDNTDISATVTSPTTHGLGLLLMIETPELGPVTMRVRLTALEGHLAAKELQVDFGTDDALKGNIAGEIGRITLDTQNPLNGVDLNITLASGNTASVEEVFGWALPELGPLNATMHLDIRDKTAVFDIKDIHTVNDEPLSVKTNGRLEFREFFTEDTLNEWSLDFDIKGQSTASLSGLMEYELPDFGPVDTRFRLDGKNGRLTVANLKLLAGRADKVKVELEGHIDELRSRTEFGDTDMQGSIHAANLASLSSIAKRDLPAAGPVRGKFSVKGNSGALTVPEFSIFVGDEDSFRMSGEGKVQQIRLSPDPEISGVHIPLVLNAPSTEQLSGLFGQTLPELGPVSTRAILVDHQGNPRLQEMVLQIGTAQQPVLQASGQLDYFLDTDSIGLDSVFETDISLLLSRITQREVPELGKVTGKMTLDDSDGTLGFEILEVSGSKVGIYSLNAKGIYDDLEGHTDVKFDMELHTEDLDHFDGLFGQDFPVTGPVDFKGHLSRNDDKAKFDGDIKFLDGIFTVDLSGLFTKERPKISGTIFTPELRTEKLMSFYNQKSDQPASVEDKTIPKSTEQGKELSDNQKTEIKPLPPLFNEEPIDFDLLKLVDLDLQITIDEVTGAESRVDKVNARVKLDDGELRIDPVDVFFESGSVKIDASAIAGEPAQVALRVLVEDVDLEKLTSRLYEEKTIDGDLHLDFDLKSKGNNQREIISNLNGDAGWAVENGKIYTDALDVLHLDVLGWFLGGVLENEEREITCAMSVYTIKDGLMTSDIFYFGTTAAEYRAKGTIYLPDEELDLVLEAHKKGLLGRGRKSYEIGGTIRQPKVKGVPFIQTIATFGKIFFAPVLFVPGTAVGDLWSMVEEGQGGACAEAREKAEKRN